MAEFNRDATVQKDYQAAMLTEMKESTGGQLTDLGEMRTITGAESTFFNRASGGTASATAPDMFGKSGVGTGGVTRVVEVKPAFAYGFEKIEDVKVLDSSVNYKGWIPKEIARQLEVNKDEKVMVAIAAEKANMTKAGVAATKLDAQLEAIIGSAKIAILDASVTPDSRPFVKMVMNKATYKALFTTDLAINNDFVQLSGMAGDPRGGIATFYGCSVVIVKEASASLVDGEIYFIPSSTLGFATWSGADKSAATYYPDDQDTWHFTAKKSFAAAVLEADAIIHFESSLT